MRSYLLKFIVFISLFSCHRENRSVEKKYYPNGQLKKEYGVLDDSILDGSFKYYFDNGNLEAEGFIRRDKNNGFFKHYYKNGKIKEIDLYDNGTLLRSTSYNETDLKVDRDIFSVFINSVSDSIKSGSIYKATVNLYNQDKLKNLMFTGACVLSRIYNSDTLFNTYVHGINYLHLPFHKDFLFSDTLSKPGEYFFTGAISFNDSTGKYNWSEFKHHIIVY